MMIGKYQHPQDKVKEKIKQRLISIPINAEDYCEEKLSIQASVILGVLESRSWNNHGHTKINNQKLHEITKIPLRTIQRALQELEKAGFIVRVVTRKFGYKNAKGVGQFYCDRFFQCNRVIIAFRCQVIPDLGWETDLRPKLSARDYKVPVSFVIDTEYYDLPSPMVKIHRKPLFTDSFDLMMKGFISGRLLALVRKLQDKAELGDSNAIKFLGVRRRKTDVSSQ